MPPAVKSQKPVEVEPDEVVIEDDGAVETPEEVATSELGLPEVDDFMAEPDEGFDYFATVHSDLKASGIVKNQTQTKELLKYFDAMARQNAFENGAHEIKGLGTIVTEVRGSKVMKATFDMPAKGLKKGDEYNTTPKYAFKFVQNGGATNWLAECAACEGWEPENFVS